MPVRFNGKRDLVGMFILIFCPVVIAMLAAILMLPDMRLIIFLISLLTVISIILYKFKNRKSG
jgi:hypothetical protein